MGWWTRSTPPASATNLGINGVTSADVATLVHSDNTFRTAIQTADVISVEVGFNDFLLARIKFYQGACGGTDNLDCLRATVTGFGSNIEQILSDIDILKKDSAEIVVLDFYFSYLSHAPGLSLTLTPDESVATLKPYRDQMAAIVLDAARQHDVQNVSIGTLFNGESGTDDPYPSLIFDSFYLRDGLHPNKTGHALIAAAVLQALGRPVTAPSPD